MRRFASSILARSTKSLSQPMIGVWRSLVSAFRLGRKGRQFESDHPDHRLRKRKGSSAHRDKYSMEKNALLALLEQGLSQRKIADHTGKSPTSIRHWLKKYGLETDVNKRGRRFVCGTCGETDRSKFYGHKASICGKCHSAYTLNKGRENRKKIIAHMGGKCVYCDFDRFDCSLQVHHLDPSKKDPKFEGYRSWSWERTLKEIEGCVLLCGNCHPAVHAGFIELGK